MNLELVKKSDYIVCLGSMISKENISLKNEIKSLVENGNSKFTYMHPVEDYEIKSFCSQYLKYEVGSEEGILAMLLEYFTSNRSKELEEFVEELDIGYISAESSAGEEEFEQMQELAQTCSSKLLILGNDLFSHDRVENIKALVKALIEYSDIEVLFLDENIKLDTTQSLEEPEELASYNGTVLFTISSDELDEKEIIGSNSFSRVAKVSDEDLIKIKYDNKEFEYRFKLDEKLQGTIALAKNTQNELSQGYRFKQVKIEKVG